MTRQWQSTVLVVSMLALLAGAAPAGAQVDFGFRAGVWLEDSDPGVGAELIMPLGPKHWYFNPNLEAVFSDRSDRLIGNLDFHFDFFETPDLTVWAGAGLAIVHHQDPLPDQDDTEPGANLFAGIGWKLDRVLPYAQLKAVLADDSELVAAVGVRF